MESKPDNLKNREFSIGTLVSNVASAWGKEEKWTDLILRVEKKTGVPTEPGVVEQQESQEKKEESKADQESAEFHCHKFILSSRSPAFKAMLMEPSDTKILDLPNLLPSTLTTLLNFIYTDQIEKKDVDTELLIVADRFEMKDLKKICCTVLFPSLAVDNSIKIYLAACQTKSHELKVTARNFITQNLAEVMKTPDWKKKSTDPDSKTFSEIFMEAYFNSKSQKTTRNAQTQTTKVRGRRYSVPLYHFSSDDMADDAEDETDFL